MKTHTTQQEILLITGTHFSTRQICPKDENAAAKPLSQIEQLEQACWNGLLTEMLPEICEHTGEGKDLYLWDIKEGAAFLSINMGEVPTEKDNYFSLDPYLFLAEQELS